MKRSRVIRFVIVVLGWTVLSGAETRAVKPSAKATAHVSAQVKANMSLRAAISSARKPLSRGKPVAKEPSAQLPAAGTKPAASTGGGELAESIPSR
jgi:hypothetical protein